MRKAFNFYNSYFEVAKELNDEDRLSFYDALITRQFTGVEIELKGMAKFAYISQKFNIDAQVLGYETKTKTTLGGSVGGIEGGSGQGKGKGKGKEKEKEERTIESRKQEFANLLKPFLEKYGKEMLNEFFLYWTEKSDRGTKMRFEKQPVFEVSKRLITWNRNYKKQNEPIEDEYMKNVMKQINLNK